MATLRISKKAKIAVTPKLPATKTRATTKTARRPTVASASTPKQRVDQLIARIRQQVDDIHSTAWDVGQALVQLRKPEIWQLYDQPNFKTFVNELVMPYTTALRFISFAEKYSKTIALEIGLERGVQLARLAKAKELGDPETIWKTNPVLMKEPRKRARDLSGAEMERLTQAALLAKARAKIKALASEAEQQALEFLKEDWAEAFDLKASFDLDLKKRKIRIEIDLDELLE